MRTVKGWSHGPQKPLALLAGFVAALCASGAALAQTNAGAKAASAAGIYTCTDDKGRRITSDRPIPDCTAKEQRVLNRDGSLQRMHPPTLTVDERNEIEARERRAAEARSAQAEAVRRDRNLLARYKTEVTHGKAREAALDTVRAAMRLTEARLADLQRERKPLEEEAEFYKGKALPPKLKTQMDANDASADAQRAAASTQQAELERINRSFDAELERLKKLWAGAAPGSLGPLVVRSAQAPAASPVAAKP